MLTLEILYQFGSLGLHRCYNFRHDQSSMPVGLEGVIAKSKAECFVLRYISSAVM